MTTTKKKDELEVQQTEPEQSSTVQQAQNTLMQLSGRNYQSQWQPQINSMMNEYLNRDKFSYDLNADALYNQLRDQYALMGQKAMMDTMGQATALTGGYGNSYAQSVGQQAYQGYMQQLSDKVPDLYQMQLDQYLNEGNQMLENMSVMMQQDSIDYDRYRDQMADQDDAFSKLLTLMTEYGYKPTEEELAYAGLTDAQYKAIMGITDTPAVAAAPVKKSSGGGGGGGGGGDDEWGEGIDETRNTSGLKASSWDYTKNNLKQLVNSGNSAAAVKYMDQITATGQMSKAQYDEAIQILEKKK